ncbi:MAG: HPr-rel-A system PqqD family peptide chaperone [Steroidobacteraceae bacterium]|nr:HPr-rel-A system PqqD family peptide chaperone [Steroidobacteraceae bacterium]
MTPGYALVPDARVEAIGDLWAAFSPVSGETMLLNDTCAAMLEILSHGPNDEAGICAALAADSGLTESELASKLADSWRGLIESGLIRQIPPAPDALR